MLHTDGTLTIANAPALRGFHVKDEGSLVLVTPLDAPAKHWLEENVDNEAQYFGAALVVEGRYFYNLLDGIFDAGFEVQS